jgi:hypothetical protein
MRPSYLLSQSSSYNRVQVLLFNGCFRSAHTGKLWEFHNLENMTMTIYHKPARHGYLVLEKNFHTSLVLILDSRLTLS